MISLLQKSETRSAGVTMLGKTVEICLSQLHEQCNRNTLEALKSEMLAIREPFFSYDIAYVMENMEWDRVIAGSPSHSPSGEVASAPERSERSSFNKEELARNVPEVDGEKIMSLQASTSFLGHTATIFSFAYDSNSSSLVSADKDGNVIMWAPDGTVRASFVCKLSACARAR